MLIDTTIFASKVRQNNQEFFISTFSIRQILSFTKYTERLIVGFDDDNQPLYNDQIQRKVEPSRIEKIADFLLDDPDAIFPTNLVLTIPNAAIQEIVTSDDLSNAKITLIPKVFSEIKKNNGDVYLTIVDGQHRIKGIERAIERLEVEINNLRKVSIDSKTDVTSKILLRKSKLLENLLNINLIVSFFLDATLEFQAMIFSTINRTQKSVPQSLVYSLFGLSERDSPQKSALQIVLALNGFEGSPFYNRIKLYGGSYERNLSPPLTQASMVKSIINLICLNNKDSERDRFRDRTDLANSYSDKVPFRKYYASNRDFYIIDIMYSFFTAVNETFVTDGVKFWQFESSTKPTNILHTVVGYYALIELLIDILELEKSDSERDKIVTYAKYLVKTKDLKFNDQQRYPFTSISTTIFYLDMHLKIWPAVNDNDPRVIKLKEALKKRVD